MTEASLLVEEVEFESRAPNGIASVFFSEDHVQGIVRLDRLH